MHEKPRERLIGWLALATVAVLWVLIVVLASMRLWQPLPPRPAVTHSQPDVASPSGDELVDVVPAKAGVGKTGRYKESGLVVTPIKAYFRTQQRTELEIKIPHALNLYKAEHGHFPETPEDFVRDIIEVNQIKLPELPFGHRYVYDGDQGLLQVEQPKK